MMKLFLVNQAHFKLFGEHTRKIMVFLVNYVCYTTPFLFFLTVKQLRGTLGGVAFIRGISLIVGKVVKPYNQLELPPVLENEL